jgi:hypothetical protein
LGNRLRDVGSVQPEWAFTNIIDRIYEHQAFLEEYVEPLTRKAGFSGVDVKVRS